MEMLMGHDPLPSGAGVARPVRAGVIGCGSFGSGILASPSPLLEIRAVSDHQVGAAREAWRQAAVPDEAVTVCASRADALSALEAGRRVIVADPMVLIELPLDVIVEATGQPEAGAKHALAAIRTGRHVVMVNKEADVTVGPILARLAAEAGVVYTPVDGDQHGSLIGLVAWSRRLGLDVLCGGKSRDREVIVAPAAGALSSGSREIRLDPEALSSFQPLAWRSASPDAPSMEQVLEERMARLGDWGRIGGWDLVELAIAANATGLAPSGAAGVHCRALFQGEIPDVLVPQSMGGILDAVGAIDAVTCLHGPGEAGLGGGVFVVVTARTSAARAVLARGGVSSGAGGEATLITRPFHLLGVEAVASILAAARHVGTLESRDYRPRFDAFVRAARDLAAGSVLGDDHSLDLDVFIGPSAPVAPTQPLPAHLANGNRLVTPVRGGAVITREMVAAPAGSALWELRARQDELFFGRAQDHSG
jgi:predicted homoserine dehydrogenase-like protein